MGRIGYWTYWFKAPDFDVTFCTNKKNLPKNQPYVIDFVVSKTDGNQDEELIMNDKVMWKKTNINKLTKCERLKLAFEIQEKTHKLLNVSYPKKGYAQVFKKKIKQYPELKGCKLK